MAKGRPTGNRRDGFKNGGKLTTRKSGKKGCK